MKPAGLGRHIAAHLIAAAGLLALLLLLVPRVERVFREFRTPLPDTAAQVVEFGDAVRRFWYSGPLVVLVDLGVLWLLGKVPGNGTRLRSGYSLLVLTAALTALLLVGSALILPLLELMKRAE